MGFSKNILDAFREYAEACAPKEACGFITPDGFVASINISNRPEEEFKIASHEILANTGYLAVLHSHTNNKAFPSFSDIQGQIDTAVPWGLCLVKDGKASDVHFWGAGIADNVPLLGRPFRHGPTGTDGKGDCFALCKDYYRLTHNIILPEFPRQDGWWEEEGENLYTEGFSKAGFYEIGKGNSIPHGVKAGDAVLMKWGRKVVGPHHAGIILGKGLLLHHRDKRLSERVPMVDWLRHVTHWLRHEGLREVK